MFPMQGEYPRKVLPLNRRLEKRQLSFRTMMEPEFDYQGESNVYATFGSFTFLRWNSSYMNELPCVS